MKNGDHFYTTVEAERDSAIATGWSYESFEAYVYPARGSALGGFMAPLSGTVRLYRLYHFGIGHHFYTTSTSERESAIASGYTSEADECFVFPARAASGGVIGPAPRGTVPLYRLYHAAGGDHFYTPVDSERDKALANGYSYEWVECYVHPVRKPDGSAAPRPEGTVKLFRLYHPPDAGEKSFWEKVGDVVEGVVDFVIDVVRAVEDAAEPIVSPVEDTVTRVVLWVTAIPVVGRIIGGVINVVGSLASGVLALPEIALGAIGIRPRKYLKLMVIVQRDENGRVVAETETVMAALKNAVKTFRDRANVQIVPLSGGFIHIETDASSAKTLDVSCGGDAFLKDLVAPGSIFDLKATAAGPSGAVRRLTGIGAPVFAFAVRKYDGDDDAGCSLSAWSDFVTVGFEMTGADVGTLAHELGHACLLTHTDEANLMYEKPPFPPVLDSWQVTKVRLSRHVSFV